MRAEISNLKDTISDGLTLLRRHL